MKVLNLLIILYVVLLTSTVIFEKINGEDAAFHNLTGPPQINSPKVYGVRPGTPFLYTVAATGQRPITFTADGLSKSLSLDSHNGLITGSIEKRGEYLVKLYAKNIYGISKLNLRIVVGDLLVLTPPMGWNTWNVFGPDISEELIKEMTNAMVSSGMRDVGYQYIIIDDHWQGQRDHNNYIMPDINKFPNGMKAVADYVHSKGLKLGIYSDAAEKTCGGALGSFGYEQKDADTYAAWGIDYLKYDYCYAPKDKATAIQRYSTMSKALRKTNRSIVFAACEWGQRQPWLWAANVGANLWRTTWDIRDIWDHEKYDNGHAGIINVMDRQIGLEQYAGPGRWNDPDMLVVGIYGKGMSSSRNDASGCTDVEYRTQMSLWSILAAPLLTSCDLRNMNTVTREILTNPEVIAINQDPLGKQGYRVFKQQDVEVWKKSLEKGHVAIALFNRGENPLTISARWIDLGIEGKYLIRDLWSRKDLGVISSKIERKLDRHETVLLRLSPVDSGSKAK